MSREVNESSRRDPAKPDTGAGHRVLVRVTMAYLLVGVVAAAAVAIGVFGSWEAPVFLAIGVATTLALVVSVRVRRPSRVWPWAAIIIAFALFLVGGILRSKLQIMGNLTAGRSLLPDLLALPGYALLAAGLLGFSRTGARGSHQVGIVLDGLITALALAALAWMFTVQPVLAEQQASSLVKVVLIAYPSMSIFLVVVTTRIVFNPYKERVPAFWFLVASMMFMFLGDAAYMLADINLIDVPNRLLDLPYALALLGAGATGLHPSMRRLTEAGRWGEVTAYPGQIALVAIALVIPAVLTLQNRVFAGADRVAMSVLMLTLTAAAVLRIVQALRTASRSEARLLSQAKHDSLTGLPNRRVMEQHLSGYLERRRVDNTHVALLFLDLDRFKLVNDTLGHRYGDDLLVQVAQRLQSSVRSIDLVCRIGGDEFMILLHHVINISEAVDLANRVRHSLEAPFVYEGMDFYVSASIGLALASDDDCEATVKTLVRDADTAMYQAKDAGRNTVAVFDESLRSQVSERVELERDLHNAVALGQLHLVYQPIVCLPRGPIIGMEALVRWAHPTRGVLSPVKFIPLAEEAGLIREIGNWVLEEAVSQFAAWWRHSPEMADLYVSVNVSGAQLRDDQLADRVTDLLTVHGLPGSSLCLELTESVAMQDPHAAAAILSKLRCLGVAIAIDDFGAEYSSLAYLKLFPATMLKIDKAFVDGLASEDSSDGSLVAAVVAMARALGITTVAEGVETSAQTARLLELGCDVAQGFLYSRPVAAERLPDVVRLLQKQRLHLVTETVALTGSASQG